MNIVLRRSSSQLPKLIDDKCRWIGIFHHKHYSNTDTKKNGYITVYKFPYVQAFALVNKLKLYQTVLSCTTIPITVILNQINVISSDVPVLTAAVGISGCITIYSIGTLVNRFIGFIYYNEEKDTAKFAYIDFWGSRKDIEIPVNDLVPITELPTGRLDRLFFTLRRFSTKDTYKFSLSYGIILDREKMGRIL